MKRGKKLSAPDTVPNKEEARPASASQPDAPVKQFFSHRPPANITLLHDPWPTDLLRLRAKFKPLVSRKKRLASRTAKISLKS